MYELAYVFPIFPLTSSFPSSVKFQENKEDTHNLTIHTYILCTAMMHASAKRSSNKILMRES